jgi:hypothetical protein
VVAQEQDKNLGSSNKRMMVDPPGGWKYGFPKEVKGFKAYGGVPVNWKVWLLANGYPENEYFEDMPIRIWYEEA